MPKKKKQPEEGALVFPRVRSRNTFEETVEAITGAIKARLLRPDNHLPPERELARQLGISRATLREALRVLINAGYLEARPGRAGGTFVARWPEAPRAPEQETIIQRIRDQLPALLDFRRAVEPTAAELAAQRATPENLAELEAILEELTGKEDSFALYRSGDTRFHVGIARAAKSPLIHKAVVEVQTALTEILDLIVYHSPVVLQHSTEYHWRIYESLCRRDGEAARQLMLDHITATEHIIHGLVPEAPWPHEYTPESLEETCV